MLDDEAADRFSAQEIQDHPFLMDSHGNIKAIMNTYKPFQIHLPH